MSGDAGTSVTSNPMTTGAAPPETDEEILDTRIAVTSNPVTAAAPAQVVISMARQSFRDVNQDLFTPLSVPIGPYHRGSCLERWEREKEHVAEETVKSGKDELIQELRGLEGVVRACYGGLCKMQSDKLVSMLLNDGCYVLHFFMEYPDLPDVKPPRGEGNTVRRDIMYLLENQLPMIVLERIHQFLRAKFKSSVFLDDVEVGVRVQLAGQLYISGKNKPQPMHTAPSHILQLVHGYFQPQLEHTSVPVGSARKCNWCNPFLSKKEKSATGKNVEHASEDTANTRRRVGRWRRATEYIRYGNVQLKARTFEDGAESILDVRLEGSALLIPRLEIDSNTWTMLRNLMALEEQTGTRTNVTAYCLFMAQLASKVEDIELLMHKDIIEHYWGNDDEVAQGFADLCKKAVLDVDDVYSNYLYDTWHRLHDRCENLGNNFWGSFRHIHCGDSMRILAFGTAGLLFAFQLIQVILSGFSLRK